MKLLCFYCSFILMKESRKLYILCGGQSNRMGSDKYGLEFKGKTFLSHLTGRAAPVFEEVILLGANHELDFGFRQIPDAVPDAGPLGGLLAALQHSDEDSIAILPVDLPLISKKSLLLLHNEPLRERDALISKSENRIQPLLGIYRTGLMQQLETYINSGERSVMGFLDRVDYQTFDVTVNEISNINTPEQYEKLMRKHR